MINYRRYDFPFGPADFCVAKDMGRLQILGSFMRFSDFEGSC